MPELPEVETTIQGLKKKVLNRTFLDVWSDWEKIIRLRFVKNKITTRQIKKPKSFKDFKNRIKNKKIKKIWRRGKNIIFDLSDGYSLLIHQKLTGHLLYGYWILDNGYWKPKEKGILEDRVNTYIHLIFFLDNGKMLALSDLRKFAKVELWKTKKLLDSKEFKKIGPEPLDKDFTFEKFKQILIYRDPVSVNLQRPGLCKFRKGKIKQVLMNQEIIAGIGNIYSDEALWRAKIHPFKDISKLKNKELKDLYKAVQEVLKTSVKLQGESISDYRTVEGKKGNFDKMRKIYRREGEKCSRCGTTIKRLKIAGRSACFCPFCQKL